MMNRNTLTMLAFFCLAFATCGIAAPDKQLNYLIVDRSGSIDSNQLRAPITEAVKTYVNSLPEESELRVVFFSDLATAGKSFSPMKWDNKTAFMAYFTKQFRPSGQTRLYDTVAGAIEEVSSISRDYSEIKMMILSDGEDTSSRKNSDWSAIETLAGNLKRDNENSFIIWYTLGFNPKSEDMPKTDAIIVTNMPGQSIVLEFPPVADFEAYPTTVKVGEIVKFFVLPSPGNINEVEWNFGDGASDKKMRTEHQYSQLGKYTVTLKVANQNGADLETKTDLVEVIADVPVNAAFSWTPEEPRVGEKIQLIDKSEGQPKDYDWEFGPFGSSKERTPTFIADKAGKIQVKLTVHRDAEAGSSTEYINILPLAPSADFSVSPESEVEQGQTLSMSAAETSDALTHEWTIGEWTANGPEAKWLAAEVGMVEVLHRASGPGGATIKSKSIHVSPPPVLPPYNCDFTITPAQIQVGEEVTIEAQETDGSCEHTWSVGKTKLNGRVVKFKALQVGVQSVVHEISGERGGKLDKSFMVIESMLPEVKVTPNAGPAPLEVECKDTSTGLVVGRTWDFGDGTVIKDQNQVKHTYTNAGVYKVNLTVRNAAGRESSLAVPMTVTVKAPPVPLPAGVKWGIIGGIALIAVIVVAWLRWPKKIAGTLSWESQGRFINQDICGYSYSIYAKPGPSGDVTLEVVEGKPAPEESEGQSKPLILSRDRDDAIAMQDGVEIERWTACEPHVFRVGPNEVKFIPS